MILHPGEVPLFDRAGLVKAFTNERLARRGVVAEVYVVGGAAMMLAYDSRRATRDVDALFTPHGVVLEEAHAVARELRLPRSWLNEQASVYIRRRRRRVDSSLAFATCPATSATVSGRYPLLSRTSTHPC